MQGSLRAVLDKRAIGFDKCKGLIVALETYAYRAESADDLVNAAAEICLPGENRSRRFDLMYPAQERSRLFAETRLLRGMEIEYLCIRVKSLYPCVKRVCEGIVAAGGDLDRQIHIQPELVMYILRKHCALAVALVIFYPGSAQYQFSAVVTRDMVFALTGQTDLYRIYIEPVAEIRNIGELLFKSHSITPFGSRYAADAFIPISG